MLTRKFLLHSKQGGILSMKLQDRCMFLGVLGMFLLPMNVQAAQNPSVVRKEATSQVKINNNITPQNVNTVAFKVQHGEIIDKIVGDVDGDGQAEDVLLMGSKIVKNSHFMGDLYVIVREQKTGKIKYYIRPQNCGGYGSFLTLADVTGDGVNNVIITSPTGGSGGMIDLRILDFTGGAAKEIFTTQNNTGIAFVGEYLPNYQVKLNFPLMNKTIVVDLTDKKELYQNLNVYDANGKVKNLGIKPYLQGFSAAVAVDTDNDGTLELLTTQKIVGPTNVETLGHVRTIWKYMAGFWQAEKTNIYLNLQTKNAYDKQIDIIGAGGYFIRKQEIELKGSKVTYPHFFKMGDGCQQGKVNGQIDAFVRKILKNANAGQQVEMSYELKYAGKKYLSVLFQGVQSPNINIMQAFNFNMQTGANMSLGDMFSDARKFWNMIKKESAKSSKPLTKAEVQGFYYDGNSLVLLCKDKRVFALSQKNLKAYLEKDAGNKVFD